MSQNKKTKIIYIRGLNTYGNEQLCFGPIRLGRMDKYWRQFFEKQNYPFISIEGIPNSNIENQINFSKKQIEKVITPEDQIIFLTHSTGGLIARGLCPYFQSQLKSVISLACPHKGAKIATKAISIEKSSSFFNKFLKLFNYDLQQKLSCFYSLTPDSMDTFNRQYPQINNIDYASLQFKLPVNAMSWPMRFLALIGQLKKSDGVIEEESQKWGKQLDSYPLDHCSQIGYHLYFSPFKRHKAKRQFEQLGKTICAYLESVLNIVHNEKDERASYR